MNYKYSLKHLISKSTHFLNLIFDFFKFYLIKQEIKDEKIFIFMGEYFPVRIQRISQLLKENSTLKIVLYISKWGYEPKLIGKNFDRTEIYRNKFHLKRLIKSEGGISLIHAFEPKAYFQYLVLKLKKETPFIYDVQDILINYFGYNTNIKWIKRNLFYEKELFKLSDGFVSQSFELNEAFRQYNIKNNKKTLLFPLYCNSKNFSPINTKLNKNKNKNNIVYIGGINGLNTYSSSNFLPFIKKLEHSNLKFTIYPSPISEVHFYKPYKSIESLYKNFTIKKSVPFNQLNLSEYSFGVVPFENDNSEKYLIKNKFASSMKFFVYLEMGIPIIISNYWETLAWITKRYNLGIVTNYNELENLEHLIEKFDYNECLKNIEVFRSKFDFWKQKDRILNFYNSFMEFKI